MTKYAFSVGGGLFSKPEVWCKFVTSHNYEYENFFEIVPLLEKGNQKLSNEKLIRQELMMMFNCQMCTFKDHVRSTIITTAVDYRRPFDTLIFLTLTDKGPKEIKSPPGTRLNVTGFHHPILHFYQYSTNNETFLHVWNGFTLNISSRDLYLLG